MSDGSGFDMTLLEGKDRAELAAIAESLGQKPGARAKKADIVSLIMRLVGADEAPAPASDETPAADAPSVEAPVASDDAEPVPTGDDREAADDEAADSDADAAPEDSADGGEPGRRGGGRNGGPGANQGQGGQRDQSGQRDRNPQGQKGQGQRDQGNQTQGGQAQGNQTQEDGDANGNQRDPQGEQHEGDGESGNRRRRRRGRDRDRRPEGEDQAPIEPITVEGLVDLRDEGYGFLRLNGYLPTRDDAYISVKQTRQFGLRTGDIVRGKSRPPARNEKNPALLQVDSVNGHEAHNQPARPRFDDLTAVFADERYTLELPDDPSNTTVRIIDLIAPIGKGSRGLIISPPRAGATTILKNVVRSIEVNHPDAELLVLLVDERPEEVTEMKRWLLRGSVASSTFDRPAEEHTSVAELVIERAKRLVEAGKDVVVVLDGLTSLTRAHNLTGPADGRTIDGVETSALFPPKKFFGAARKAEEGGSLTILATVQVDTGSRIDEFIFEEFTGTANLELRLDRRLADRSIFPAVDVAASSTRRDDLLVDRAHQPQIAALRSELGELAAETGSNVAGAEMLASRLAASKTNADLLAKVAKVAKG